MNADLLARRLEAQAARLDRLEARVDQLEHVADRLGQQEGADVGALEARLGETERRCAWLEAQSEGVDESPEAGPPQVDDKPAPAKPRRKRTR